MQKPLRYQHYKDYQLVEPCLEKPYQFLNDAGTANCTVSAALARVDGVFCYGYIITAVEVSSGVTSILFKVEDYVKEKTTFQAIYDGFYEDYVIEEL